MICSKCGAHNDEGYRFCAECGAPLDGDATLAGSAGDATVAGAGGGARPANMPPVPVPGPVPMPGQSAQPVQPAQPVQSGRPTQPSRPDRPNQSGATAVKRNHTPLIVAIIVAVLIIAGAVVAFLTYRNEVWGGKALPDPGTIVSQVKNAKGKKTGAVKAEDVTAALELKGLRSKTVQEFSGADRGVFLGYDGANPGDRVTAGSTVTVRESAGPGVPKDTIGKKADNVVNTFVNMGVPVHYKQVVIASDSKTPEGQVAVTSPAPGVGLTKDQESDGIYIGVTAKGSGIPVDIQGKDKDKAKSDLEALGYDVDLEPHYSSQQYVGKISGSYPAPGSTLESGDKVTLYYGVDKSSNMDLFSTTNQYDGSEILKKNATPLIGMYCKSTVTDASKDCITLEEAEGPYGDSAGGGFLQMKEHQPDQAMDTLGMGNFSQDVSGVMLSPGEYMSADKLPMKNHLLLGKTGAFELYAGMNLPNCGDHIMSASIGEFCNAGTYERGDPSNFTGTSSGTTYNMKDFLLYVPVGTDIKELETAGYFDADAVAAAGKQKAVDGTRPFIVMRDSSQYKETSVSADGVNPNKNPFVPGNDNGTNHLVKMKPAPSDATVYYLMEQNSDLDWSSLPDAKVKQPEAKSESKSQSGDADAKSKSSKTDKVFTEAMKEAQGDYTFSSGAGAWYTDLTVEDDGTFHGEYTDLNAGDIGDDHPHGSRNESKFTGQFSSAKKNDDGTYTLQCDTKSFAVDGTVGSSHIEDDVKVNITKPVGMDPCGTFTLYPKGYDIAKLDDSQTMWANGGSPLYGRDSLPGPALLNNDVSSDYKYTFYSGLS